MKTIRWGIIGCGDVCEKKSGPAFYKVAHSGLVAVMRRDGDKARDYAMRHDVARYYSDAEKLINDPEVNAVYIATPPDTHKEYAIRAMRAGKPVYVEKPMALTYQECLEMLQVSEETGQPLFVAFYRRGMDYFRKVKELVDKGEIGSILTVEGQYIRAPFETDLVPEKHTWRIKKDIAGGGYFYDLAPHTLDIIDFIVGKIVRVKGFATNLGNIYEPEDTLAMAFSFENGALGTAQWCFVAGNELDTDTVILTGTKGRIIFNTFAFKPIELEKNGQTILYTIAPPEHVEMPLIQTIVEELRGEGICPSPAKDAIRTAWVMDQVFQE